MSCLKKILKKLSRICLERKWNRNEHSLKNIYHCVGNTLIEKAAVEKTWRGNSSGQKN